MHANYPRLEDFSPEELIEVADRHDDLAFGEMLGTHPEMRQGDGLYEILTGLASPYANMLFGLQVPNARQRVAEVTDRVATRQIPAYWWVGPCTLPRDLPELLVAAGWREEHLTPAMVVDLDRLVAPAIPPGLEVREVRSAADLAAWHELIAIGSSLDRNVAKLMNPPLDGPMTLFTAFLEDQPVGTSGLFLHAGVPGIYCVSVLPEFRKRGIGAAVTSIPLQSARAKGYRMATLQASSMGHPVYKRLGFEDVCHLRLFEFVP